MPTTIAVTINAVRSLRPSCMPCPLYSSSNNTLKGNTVSGNNFGIDLNFPSNNNTLKGNTASGNVNHGILLNSLSNNDDPNQCEAPDVNCHVP